MTPASGVSVCYRLALFSSHSFAILSTYELCPELTFLSVLGINSVSFWHLGMFFITKYLGYTISLPYGGFILVLLYLLSHYNVQ